MLLNFVPGNEQLRPGPRMDGACYPSAGMHRKVQVVVPGARVKRVPSGCEYSQSFNIIPSEQTRSCCLQLRSRTSLSILFTTALILCCAVYSISGIAPSLHCTRKPDLALVERLRPRHHLREDLWSTFLPFWNEASPQLPVISIERRLSLRCHIHFTLTDDSGQLCSAIRLRKQS